MKAREAAAQLGFSPHDFGQRLLAWIEELGVRPSRVLMLEEHLSAEAFAERIHVDLSTANRVFRAITPRRKLSRKCVRVPASALASFIANKKLPKRKGRANG
jgi:hypothetical protein